jgi:hypothetical protein
MKKILWTAFSIIGLINRVSADAGIHFYNKTWSTIYLTSKYTRNSSLCRGKFTKVVKVRPGKKYKFSVTHGARFKEACYLSLLGYTDANLSESSIALQEKFHIKIRGFGDSNVTLHESPPSKCGLGMTCSTHLTNDTESLYIKITTEYNQYARIMFNNNTRLFRYIKFTHLKGKCNNYVKNNPWVEVLPKNIKIGYILDSLKDEICLYKVEIAGNNQGRNLICSSILKIYNDANNNATIDPIDGNCNITMSDNNWLASISLK